MVKFLSNIGAVLAGLLFAFCWQVTLILASLGLGSAAFGNWVQGNKGLFLASTLSLLTLSFASAVREKMKRGKNSGLVIFAVALIISAFLLSYNKIRYGSFI